MKRLWIPVVACFLVAGLVLGGPSPTATAATAGPAKKVDFPERGKAITIIVPWNAGGSIDVSTRMLAAVMEKDLGVPITIVNKPGASGQVGVTELAKSKPDGYTIGNTNIPSTLTAYLDPQRQAAFARKDLLPFTATVFGPTAVAVKADSPYKNMKDLLDAAKANPGRIKASAPGILSVRHLGILQVQQLAGVQFATVQFSGGAPQLTALLGGHVDAGFQDLSEFLPQFKSGGIRVLGMMDREESKFFPGVKTMEAQGYRLYSANVAAFSLPAGTPPGIAQLLSSTFLKAMNDPQVKQKAEETAMVLRPMTQAQVTAYWSEVEAQIKPLMDLAK